MTGYTKLFGSIVASTIWREPHQTRIVWITMLALANKNGMVEASIPGLADLARVTVEECEEALKVLMSPDPYSRTKTFEGRRVQEADGGWFVLNHPKYRAKMNADERREYLRVKQQEHRAKDDPPRQLGVNNRKQMSTPSTHAEADSETKADAKANSESKKKKEELPDKSGSAHGEFIKLWTDGYFAHHKVKYAFQGAKDGNAVKHLLSVSGLTAVELAAIAQEVWNHSFKMIPFLQSQSVTIAGFSSKINEFQDALKRIKNGQQANGKPQPIAPDYTKGF